jgi:hypothetical protein
VSDRPAPQQLVGNPEAVLTRTDLAQLGWPRRAIDVLFANCPVIELPGYRKPLICVKDYQAYLAAHSYDDRRADRVRPCGSGGVEG